MPGRTARRHTSMKDRKVGQIALLTFQTQSVRCPISLHTLSAGQFSLLSKHPRISFRSPRHWLRKRFALSCPWCAMRMTYDRSVEDAQPARKPMWKELKWSNDFDQHIATLGIDSHGIQTSSSPLTCRNVSVIPNHTCSGCSWRGGCGSWRWRRYLKCYCRDWPKFRGRCSGRMGSWGTLPVHCRISCWGHLCCRDPSQEEDISFLLHWSLHPCTQWRSSQSGLWFHSRVFTWSRISPSHRWAIPLVSRLLSQH